MSEATELKEAAESGGSRLEAVVRSQWVPLTAVLKCLEKVRDDFAWWCGTPDGALKYIELRIDMRGQFCVIRDRNGKPVSLEELQWLTAPNAFLQPRR